MGLRFQCRPNHSKTTDLDIALCDSTDPNIIMTLVGTEARSDQYGPRNSMAQEHQLGFRQQCSLGTSTWFLVATLTKDMNSDTSHCETSDTDVDSGSPD